MPSNEFTKHVFQPWEERMKEAHDRKTLVLLLNLDPTYTSHEVEDKFQACCNNQYFLFQSLLLMSLKNIVWHGLGYGCTAKMVPHTALSSPHSGQAFAIFKTPEAAKKIVRKLDEECLILPNGRALVGVFKVLTFFGKKSSFPGHLVIDKLRNQMSRELREAVSTSHTSQPNNLEYEMALDWRMLQERSNAWWNTLHKKQIEEIESLKTKLQSK
ncbi:protein ANTI-SILENCING 1-like [Chenopodium quinoa]|uniref:protein ANTI-SILENCING 1-like n=1 Tax=Chenopodium quinoa TaxID=63459 RepID=UPI000B778E42|nr:protein ANTI-SILENCING 1-like [Chenopodium quinoa]